MDIESIEDIKLIVNKFYEKVLKDSLIGVVFTEVIKLDFDIHLPIMYRFWGSVVLGIDGYTGNPIAQHLRINKQFPLKKIHFDRWIKLFNQTIDEYFAGDLANKMKNRAYSIMVVMLSKINSKK